MADGRYASRICTSALTRFYVPASRENQREPSSIFRCLGRPPITQNLFGLHQAGGKYPAHPLTVTLPVLDFESATVHSRQRRRQAARSHEARQKVVALRPRAAPFAPRDLSTSKYGLVGQPRLLHLPE